MILESNTLDFLYLQDGEKGEPGKDGEGKVFYTWVKYSQNADGSNLTDDPTNAIYMGVSYNNESLNESNNPLDYTWVKIKGEQGNIGDQGKQGYTIILSNENISFATNLNRKPLSTQTHSCEILVMQGEEIINDFTIGSITHIAEISVSVDDKNITMSVSPTLSLPVDSTTITIPVTIDGVTFKKNITCSISKQGESGNIGISVESIEIWYYKSFSNVGLSGGSWSTDVPEWEENRYVWTKQKTILSDGTSTETMPVCITGSRGESGALGQSVSSIKPQYYLSTSKVQLLGDEWGYEQKNWTSGYYVWTRFEITYINPDDVKYTDPICDSTWEAIQTQISDVSLKVDENQKSIALKASKQDIIDQINTYDGSTVKIIRDQITDQTLEIGKVSTTIKDVQTEVEKKADGSTVQTLSDKITKAEQNIDGFKQTVQDNYTTKTENSETLTAAKSYAEQQVSGFKTVVEETYSTKENTKDAVAEAKSYAEQQVGGFKTIVEKDYLSKEDFGTAKEELDTNISGVKSSITQTAGAIREEINTVDGKVTQVTTDVNGINQKVTDIDGKVTEVTTTINGVKTEVENARGDEASLDIRIGSITTRVENAEGDVSEALRTATENAETIFGHDGTINQLVESSTSVEREIADARGNKVTLSEKINELNNRIENTKGEISDVKQTASSYEITLSSLQEQLGLFKKSFKFTDEGLIISQDGETSNSNLSLRLDTGKISFLEGNAEVAYISNNKLHICNASILESLQIGNFEYRILPNGSVTFGKITG